MRSQSFRHFGVAAMACAVAITIAAAALLAGCSKKKSSAGATVASDNDAGSTKKKDSGVKKHPDAGSADYDAGADAEIGIDATVVYRDAGTQTSYGNDAGKPPTTWTCPASFWADGICDCSCGAYDWDCHSNSCTTAGCMDKTCDACFTSNYAWQSCLPAPDPNAWTCSSAELNDGNCDCGCGYPDPACLGSGCTEPGCWRARCDVRHDSTGSALPSSSPPITWTCPKAEWGGGDGCDCGCGDVDPDCMFGVQVCTTPLCVANECENCHDKDGRTLPACDFRLDPGNSNGWKCDPWHFNTKDGCDCGCGAADPDCAGDGCTGYACSSTTSCTRCTDSSFPSDELVGCVPQGAGAWTCDKHHYGTGDGCDCGCGIPDPDCGAAANGCTAPDCKDPGKCDYCHKGATEALTDYAQCKPDAPAKGWTCGDTSQPAWADPKCDCGCGKPDPYCRTVHRDSCTAAGCQTAVCQYCNDKTGARAACAGPTWNELGSCEVAVYGGDGKCDCGCGAIDPDCATGDGCAEPGCGLNGCQICHASGGIMQTCQFWTCPKGTESNGKCDCGCGAPDPECNNQGCVEPGCTTATCEAWHDPHGRTVSAP